MKVALVSRFDYAGSGYRIAESVNLNSKIFSEYFVYFPVGFPESLARYPALFNGINAEEQSEVEYTLPAETGKRMSTLLNEADIIHLKGDEPPNEYFLDQLKVKPKKLIVTVHGTGFRGQTDFSEYQADLLTVGDPVLNYEGFDCLYTQLPYPTHKFKPTWKPGNVIAHSPSAKRKKGTEKFEEAVEMLKATGYDVKTDIIHNASYEECLKRKSEATIFFDQSEVGWYGNAAVEAMALGIPTLAYIAPEAYEGAQGKIDMMPPINCGNSVESIYGALKVLLDGDMALRSKQMRKWAVDFHSYKTVGEMWSKIYKGL
jgi:glycosyltransferase involved in cell wall biosynthesis